MNDYPTLQETFDAAANMPAANLAMFFDMDEAVKKHMDTIKSKGLTNELFDEYAAIAEKYGVHYVHPKYATGLRPVETRPTVH